jgi:hypothetical protein
MATPIPSSPTTTLKCSRKHTQDRTLLKSPSLATGMNKANTAAMATDMDMDTAIDMGLGVEGLGGDLG